MLKRDKNVDFDYFYIFALFASNRKFVGFVLFIFDLI